VGKEEWSEAEEKDGDEEGLLCSLVVLGTV
jgi:hypothetical protein